MLASLVAELLLGIGVWAAGYLGWWPRTRLMSPVTEQHAGQVIVPLLQHAAFGVAVVASNARSGRNGRSIRRRCCFDAHLAPAQ
jgi:hypothetical protein